MGEGLGDDGLGVGRLPPSRWKDAELVALRIGKHDPRLRSLTDIRPPGTQLQQPVHLGRLVTGTEVRMYPPSMPPPRAGTGKRRNTSRTAGKAWLSCQRTSLATAVGS
jgi:hypothetical protein